MEIRAQEPTDEQLVRQALTERDAFGMLVERYERPLTSYAARLIGRQEAEDVVQQAFLQAYRNLAGFDTHLTFSAWMYRIVHNTAVNTARKRHGTMPTELALDGETVEILTGDTECPRRGPCLRNLKGTVGRALGQLDQRSRDDLLLSVVEGKSYSEDSGYSDGSGTTRWDPLRAGPRAQLRNCWMGKSGTADDTVNPLGSGTMRFTIERG